jgi:Phage gp6-like head-tail connector protein
MPLEFSRVTLPPLWTVDEAKVHLRITDTAADADVQQKLDAAQEAIVAYLTDAVEPTWEATTAPKAVKHAVLLLLTHLYENRGDDGAADDQVWAAIGRLLALYRDPTLA